MTIAGVVLLILQRRKKKGFSLRIAGRIIFGWCILVLHFIICGVFSVFACLDIAPCTELLWCLQGYRYHRVWILVILWTLPPDTWLSDLPQITIRDMKIIMIKKEKIEIIF